jgi:FKBP-type peptidyl-prolyl cis-trans isomerase
MQVGGKRQLLMSASLAYGVWRMHHGQDHAEFESELRT